MLVAALTYATIKKRRDLAAWQKITISKGVSRIIRKPRLESKGLKNKD
jgi:hypothetical protein